MGTTEIILAVISLFAGKEFWSHLKYRLENKRKDEEIVHLKKKNDEMIDENVKLRRRTKALESSNNRYKKLLK